MRCVRFDRWRGATKEHSRQRSVTEEQRSHRSNLAQPSGLPSFSPLPALLAPYRPLTGMLVARALAAAKNPATHVSKILCHSTGFGSTRWLNQITENRGRFAEKRQ